MDKSSGTIGWLICAAIAAWMFALNGGATRTELTQGFTSSYCGQERHFGLDGERPGCAPGSNQPNLTDEAPEVASS